MNKPNTSNPIRKTLWNKLQSKSEAQIIEMKKMIELKTKDKRYLPCDYVLSKYKVTLEFINILQNESSLSNKNRTRTIRATKKVSQRKRN